MSKTNYVMKNAERVYSKDINFLKLNRTFEWKKQAALLQKKAADKKPTVESEIKSCTICHSDDVALFCTVYDYPYFECGECKHVFLGFQITDESMVEMYQNHEDTIYLDDSLFDIRVNDIATPKLKFIDKYVSTAPRLLDIGAGVGEIVSAAHKLGWEALGLDADPVEVGFAQKRGINVRQTYVTESNVRGLVKDFNAVTFFNVIEHIKHPLDLLAIVSGALAQGTLVCIEVPRHPSVSSVCNMAFPNMVHRHIYPPEHLNIFSEKSMEIMLEKCSLEPVAIWLYGQDFYELISCAFSEVSVKNDIVDKFLSLTNEFQKTIDQNDLSDFMLVLARKKSGLA